MPSSQVISENIPIPKSMQRIPCVIVSADTLSYDLGMIVVNTNGKMQIYTNGTVGVEFQGSVIANGSYELA